MIFKLVFKLSEVSIMSQNYPETVNALFIIDFFLSNSLLHDQIIF